MNFLRIKKKYILPKTNKTEKLKNKILKFIIAKTIIKKKLITVSFKNLINK